MHWVLDPQTRWTADDLARLASGSAVLRWSARAQKCLERSHAVLRGLIEAGTPIYGTTTGFGPLVRYGSSGAEDEAHARGLLDHLGAGCGPAAPDEVVRAAMAVRLLTLGRGHSGVAPAVADAYRAWFNTGAAPVVPALGSVGASGDLVPLAHTARVLLGLGQVSGGGRRVSAAVWRRRHHLPAVRLRPRDALGLVNGTAFTTAWAALAWTRGARLVRWAEALTGLSYRLLRARREALDPRLHLARGQAGQIESARAILAAADAGGSWAEDPKRPLQEIYSLRCAPQVLGGVRAQLDHARVLLEAEINGVDDNPLIVPPDEDHPEGRALHGGNFHAQPTAFAADALNAGLTQAAVLADRQIDLLLTPAHNGGAPLLLSAEPGRHSGLAGAQITATSVVSEMRGRCQHHATSSIPTNGGNQDIVPMSATAARAAWDQTAHFASVLAVQAVALRQLRHLRLTGRAPGAAVDLPDWLPAVAGLDGDRALHDDLARVAQHLLASGPGSL